jgi:hypothetical protein
MNGNAIETFEDLTKIAIWQEFVWHGDLYRAICAPKVEIRNGYETVFIRANRRNFAMPSGWECADVMETRQVEIEPEADTDSEMAMMILQGAINALDPSILEQIAAHLESHRDMADKAVKHANFTTKAHVIQSDMYDAVRSLATYCRVAIDAQTPKGN